MIYDSRLYQPDFLGLVDIIRLKHDNSFKAKEPNYVNWVSIKSARCYVTGGQLSVSDVASSLGIHKYEYRHKHRSLRLIHELADDLARVHVDSAGRRHHFWVWGDLPIISGRLASSQKYIELQKKEKEEAKRKMIADSLDKIKSKKESKDEWCPF